MSLTGKLTETLIRDSIVLMLEDFEVLPVDHATRRACLYLADGYGLCKAARELDELYRTADWRTVKSARVVKWFVRRLRSFERTKSCLD